MSGGQLATHVRTTARDLLGLESLRPGQAESIEAVVDGRDVLAVMPTGSGKSAIYQVAGALIEGPTLVVSPLIALQHDQVEHIGDDLGGAAQVNSTMTDGQRRTALERAGAGQLEFLFLAPEQLANEETMARLREAGPSLVVVDEAHCISGWGHDFRPDYRRLGTMLELLGRPRVLALTATAAPPVRADIVDQLGLREPVVVVAGFERPNLHLEVVRVAEQTDALPEVEDRLDAMSGTGIVYVATRQEAEAVAERLDEPHRPSLAYHAGLPAAERATVHERFRQDEPCVVVATTAFGMGIDVPHVRFVVHLEPPESLDAYLQEIGRAGRDGEPARALLVRARSGGNGRRFFAGIGEIPAAEVARVAEAVATSVGPLPLSILSEVSDLTDTRLHQVLQLLERAEAVEVAVDEVRWRTTEPVEQVASLAAGIREAEREVERTRRDMVERYVDTPGCRWQTLLSYFGEAREEPCGHCDRCEGGAVGTEEVGDRPFPLQQRVRHPEFGEGEVVAYEGATMTVLFDGAGYRTLGVDLVVERELLARVS